MANEKLLSHIQRHSLTALAESDDSYQRGWGCTNRTMEALANRGLAKFCWMKGASAFGHWEITEAGRQFLAKQ